MARVDVIKCWGIIIGPKEGSERFYSSTREENGINGLSCSFMCQIAHPVATADCTMQETHYERCAQTLPCYITDNQCGGASLGRKYVVEITADLASRNADA